MAAWWEKRLLWDLKEKTAQVSPMWEMCIDFRIHTAGGACSNLSKWFFAYVFWITFIFPAALFSSIYQKVRDGQREGEIEKERRGPFMFAFIPKCPQ